MRFAIFIYYLYYFISCLCLFLNPKIIKELINTKKQEIYKIVKDSEESYVLKVNICVEESCKRNNID